MEALRAASASGRLTAFLQHSKTCHGEGLFSRALLHIASRTHQFEEPEHDLATSVPVLLSSTQHTVLLAPPSMPSTTDMHACRTQIPPVSVQMSARQRRHAMPVGAHHLFCGMHAFRSEIPVSLQDVC